MSLPITPETRVGALLEAYPGIDEVLIAWVPAFAKLKNPILRRTVAKVATLEQAARVGGVSVRELVVKLRSATGQAADDTPSPVVSDGAEFEAPAWVTTASIRFEIDADSMLEAGEHPLGKVSRCAAGLGEGEAVRLASSFRPAPLLDSMNKGGYQVYCTEQPPGRYVTYIARR
jgi:hypothetical protein